MYSNNDFRYYSENHLEHKSIYGDFKFPGGKNTPEYNHAYYLANLWRWGVNAKDQIKEGAQNLLDKTDLDERAAAGLKSLKGKVNNAINKSNTKLDDKARDMYSSAKKTLSNVGKSAYNRASAEAKAADRYVKAYNNVKKLQRSGRDSGRRAEAAQKEFTAAQKQFKDSQIGRQAANAVKTAVKNAPVPGTKTYERRIKVTETPDGPKYSIERNTRNATVGEVVNSAKKAVERQAMLTGGYGRAKAYNTKKAVGDAVDTAKKTASVAKSAFNRAIDNSNTKIDDNLRSAYHNVKETVKNSPTTIKNLKDSATKSAATAVDNMVKKVTSSVKDALGYDERIRRDVALTAASKRPTKSNVANLKNRMDEYNKTPLAKAEKVYNAAKSTFDKASSLYGEGTKGARKAAESLATAANNVVKSAKDTLGYDERDRRDAARSVQKSYPSRSADYYAERRQAEYSKTPLGKAENAGRTVAQYKDSFENIAKSTYGAASGAASRAVNSASAAITAYAQAVERFGSDSKQAAQAYYDALSEISAELRKKES